MKLKSKILWLLVPLAAIAVLTLITPWKGWLAGEITRQMRLQGVEVASLKIDGITPSKIILKDIVLGEKAGLTLQNLAVDYSPFDLLSGKLKTLTLSDLKLDVRQENGVWSLNGIKSSDGTGTIDIPDTQEAINNIPVDSVNIQNATANIVSETWELSLPLSLVWQKNEPFVSLQSDSLSFKQHDFKFKTGALVADVKFKDGTWSGAWNLDGVEIPDYPFISVKGTIEIKDNILRIIGDVKAEKDAGSGAFKLIYPFGAPEKISLVITQGTFAWGGGTIKAANTKIPLDGKTDIKTLLDIQNISVDTVLDLVAGQDVQATGTLSGKLPFIITPQGKILLEKGGMSANGDGVISLPASAIPGSGAEIDMTRSILENFEYDGLSIDVQELEGNRIALILSLSGNNPKVYDARAVKLNVRLGGDVLEFLQSNLMLFTDPQSLLDQENK